MKFGAIVWVVAIGNFAMAPNLSYSADSEEADEQAFHDSITRLSDDNGNIRRDIVESLLPQYCKVLHFIVCETKKVIDKEPENSLTAAQQSHVDQKIDAATTLAKRGFLEKTGYFYPAVDMAVIQVDMLTRCRQY